MGGDNLNEEKLEELLTLMRSVVPDISDMNDAGKVGFVYKKDYSPDTTYEESDIVLYNMTLWIAKTDTTGNPPPDQSQEGQEEVNENEFWELFLPGVLGKDYVKKTDYAQPGIAGVVQPDGKTIKVGKKGLLTGAAAGFTGTLDEFKAALAAGELSPGDIVNITDDYVAVPPGSLFISGTTEEINAMLAAGEIEDGTIVIITDDYTDPASITRSEFDTVAQTAAENKQHLGRVDSALFSNVYPYTPIVHNCINGYEGILRSFDIMRVSGAITTNADFINFVGTNGGSLTFANPFSTAVYGYVNGNFSLNNAHAISLEINNGAVLTTARTAIENVSNVYSSATIIGATITGNVSRSSLRLSGSSGALTLRECHLDDVVVHGNSIVLDNCTGSYYEHGVYKSLNTKSGIIEIGNIENEDI